jgi:drug/metabolite transporter (DMT)-like permease
LKQKLSDWILFIVLSLIWGSSFILMKIGLRQLNPYQVASMRILSAGLVLLPFARRAFKKIPKNKIALVLLAGLFGSFFPAYLFCMAETKIDSSLASILNALTPLFTIVIGVSFFKLKVTRQKIIGVLIGFIGLCLLPFASKEGISFSAVSFSLLVLIATVFYGLNSNIVSGYLKEIGSLDIAAAAFSFLIIPCIAVLFYTGFFAQISTQQVFLIPLFASIVLGIFGTAIATVIFYKIVKSAGNIFASLVTYAIPIVAILWGLLYGESFTALEAGCLLIILGGVYLVSK